jgi:hypothetical protein
MTDEIFSRIGCWQRGPGGGRELGVALYVDVRSPAYSDEGGGKGRSSERPNRAIKAEAVRMTAEGNVGMGARKRGLQLYSDKTTLERKVPYDCLRFFYNPHIQKRKLSFQTF